MPDDALKAESIQTLITLLQHHLAFVELPPEMIAEFAGRAEIRIYHLDDEIIKKGDRDEHFFIVINGQIRAIDTDYTPPRLLNHHLPGDIIGVRALLGDTVRPRSATIEADTDVVMAVFSRDDWNWLVERQPHVEEYFEGLERGFEERAQTYFSGQHPDEVVVARSKRHWIAFVASLTWPLVLLIIALLVVIGDELLGVTFLSAVTDNLWLTIVGIMLPVILAVLLAIYDYLDWRNDDFIVTSKRVIHIERVLLIRTERHEVPLTRIQNVTVKSHGAIDELVNSHDIEITTAGAGVLAFAELPEAHRFSELILEAQARAKARVSAEDVASIRSMIKNRLQTTPAVSFTPKAEKPKIIPPRRILPKLPKLPRSYIFPQIAEKTQMKSGDKMESAVIWRKHYFVLLKHIFLPVLVSLFLLYLLITSSIGSTAIGFDLGWTFQFLFMLCLLASLFWFLWEYDDWWRDIYIVTESRIIDVESTAFRLRGVRQREGDFDSIQNITYRIPNLFYNLISLGDVDIQTAAGAGENFTFYQVLHPSVVQEEIFERWDAFQRKRDEKRRDDTNKQIVAVLGEYHEMAEPE